MVMFRKRNETSNHYDHINRNVDIKDNNHADFNELDADIEIIKMNSSHYGEQSDSDEFYEHELAINEAWQFINGRGSEDNTQNGYNNITPTTRSGGQHESKFRGSCSEIETCKSCRSDPLNTDYSRRQENAPERGTNSFTTINDYLATLDNENVSDDENHNTFVPYNEEAMKENYFSHVDEAYDAFSSCNKTYEEGAAMLIYSYKNRHPLSENNENILNYSSDSPDSSSSSISAQHLNEESVKYERNFYKVSTSFHPIIIPRLHLTSSYMLPTVTEILEPNKQSPKFNNKSNKDSLTPTRINGWLEQDKTKPDDILDSVVHSYTDSNKKILSPKQTQNYVDSSNKFENLAKSQTGNSLLENNEVLHITDLNNANEETISDHSRRTIQNSASVPDKSIINSFTSNLSKENIRQINNCDLDIDEAEIVCKDSGKGVSNSFKCKDMYSKSTQISDLSATSISKSYLTFDSHAGDQKRPWFKRFIKFIICCK